MKKLIYSVTLILVALNYCLGQNYQLEDIKIQMERGTCFMSTLSINNTSLLKSNQNKIYNGKLVKADVNSAFVVIAYPQGSSPSASNKVDITAYSKSGGNQEISVTKDGRTKIYYNHEIKSSKDDYGYHFILGVQSGNLIDKLLDEQIRIDINVTPCNGNAQQTNQTTVIYQQVPVPVANSNEGCADLQEALSSISKKMYTWPHEDKGAAWLTQTSKKIFDAPQGCIGRSDEVLKLLWVGESIYPKFNEDDKRYAWVRNMINVSLNKPSKFKKENWSGTFDELVQEAKEIFEWPKEDKIPSWVTKKINKMYNN